MVYKIFRKFMYCDVVHTIVPGSIGLLGLILIIVTKKHGFVRYCGNWEEPKTYFDRLIKSLMRFYASKNLICFATGGGNKPPYPENQFIKWIHSTTINKNKMNILNNNPNKTLGENINLLHVGRQEYYKGTHLVIEALAEIKEDYPNVKLDIIGNGSYLKQLKALAEQKNIKHRTKFLGQIPNNKIFEYYKNANIFCFPSFSEGFPKVILEAMATGTPVICSNVSVLPYLINESNGIEILNKDHIICHLDEGVSFSVELTVDTGKGYVAADKQNIEDSPIGLIAIDALFSPVKRVSYNVVPTREGQVLDYDKLTMEIETDGSITGVCAFDD